MTQRLVVAITGATGVVYGIRLLERLAELEVETHLIISPWGRRTINHETRYSVDAVQELAHTVEQPQDLGSAISSGSFVTGGMVVAPCSVKTMAAISNGLADTLISRAADVVIKERRRLVLVVRETPLSAIHLENMLKLSRLGVTIMPPMPAFYNHPEDLPAAVDYFVTRVLDQFGLSQGSNRWDGRLLGPA